MGSVASIKRSCFAVFGSLVLTGAIGASVVPVQAQSRCVQLVAWTAPNLLRCQQIGQDYLGRPIWLCC